MAANLILGIPLRYVIVATISAAAVFVAFQVKGTVVSIEEILTDESSSLSGNRGSVTILGIVGLALYFLIGKR